MATLTGWSKRGHGNTKYKPITLSYGGGTFHSVVTFDIAMDDGEKASTVVLTEAEAQKLQETLTAFLARVGR